MTDTAAERCEYGAASNRAPAIVLPQSAKAPALARQCLRSYADRLPPAALESALIVMSELVTNAVLHGQPEISLSIEIEPAFLRVVVTDTGSELPPARPTLPPSRSTRGRGLTIIDQLATRWGVTRDARGLGKSIWFVLHLD